jgi:sigma-B regulation protein RsbU (phosphoserine phosphatase)
LTHNFPARAKELCETRSAVRNFLLHCGCASNTVEDVVLAIDEACQNIIRHAYHGETNEEIILHISRNGNCLNISLEDFAPEVSADCMKPRELADVRPGGLGCHFIKQVMDEVSVGPSPNGRGNILRMVKQLP